MGKVLHQMGQLHPDRASCWSYSSSSNVRWLSDCHQQLSALAMVTAVEYLMAAPLPDANQTPSSPPEANNGPSSGLASGGCRFRPGRPLAIQPGRVRR
jgi:hypothetical protein